MSDTEYFHLYEVEYISCEGNFRTDNVVIKSDDAEPNADRAKTTYYSNSDSWGDSPSEMTGAYHLVTFDNEDDMTAHCRKSNMYPETYPEY